MGGGGYVQDGGYMADGGYAGSGGYGGGGGSGGGGSNFCGNLCGSIGCMFCGLILAPFIFWGIFANERNLVTQGATIGQIKKAVEVPECSPLPGLDGRLIFATGCKMAVPELAQGLPEPLRPFIPTFHGANLQWNVQIYQWARVQHSQTIHNRHGQSFTRYYYTYQAEWSSTTNPSFTYGHYNRGRFPSNVPRDSTLNAPPNTVYAYGTHGTGFFLDDDLISQLPSRSVMPQQATVIPRITWEQQGWGGPLQAGMLRVDGQYLTTAATYGAPRVGDLRIWFSGQTASDVTMAAEQTPDSMHPGYATLKAYPPHSFDVWGSKTYALEKLYPGHKTKNEVMSEASTQSKLMGWVWRIVLLISMMCACNCIFSPISAMAHILRIIDYVTCCLELGTILDSATQCVIGCASCLCATFTFMLAVTLCWIMVRPTLALLMLSATIASIVGSSFYYKRKKKVADAREDFYLMIDA